MTPLRQFEEKFKKEKSNQFNAMQCDYECDIMKEIQIKLTRRLLRDQQRGRLG